MKNAFRLRAGLVLGGGLLLAGCGLPTTETEPKYEVVFARPFPEQAGDKASFPARHQGEYAAADSSASLCIGPTAVWRQELRQDTSPVTRQQLDSLRALVSVDSTYQDLNGQVHSLRILASGSVRDSWLRRDTLFTLTGPSAGRLRKFQGRYYLNTLAKRGANWQVQRLEITGRQLFWQTLGQDTLRLRALDTASVHIQRRSGFSLFQLKPARGQQTRRVGEYAGLWETTGEFVRCN